MFPLNERRTCTDYGAGTEKNRCSRFEMSDALMGPTGRAVRSLIWVSWDLFSLSWRGHGEALHTQSCSLSCLDPLTGTGHAPVKLPRVGGQYSTRPDPKVKNWAQLQLFKVSRSG